MSKRQLLFGLTTLLVWPQFGLAQSAPDQIVKQLYAQGYSAVSVERTWLGRTRILARNSEAQREIIVNPATGEILRDFWKPLASSARAAKSDVVITEGSSGSSGGSSGSGSSGSGTGSDDSGSGNSGSGSSGSDDDDSGEDDSGSDDHSGSNSGSGSGHGSDDSSDDSEDSDDR
ncbi:hypothetical protein [Phaeovulum sp. W22_SRMD_FR3]|uniref:hypothetical protein n=1 Tax=Phaeovulum sp. W22_SRMD_FR3 TaxID=3240274 RepID=UPI003F999FC5